MQTDANGMPVIEPNIDPSNHSTFNAAFALIGTALVGKSTRVVSDLNALSALTGPQPGQLAVVLALGSVFRRNSANTTWVQTTPSQVPSASRDSEYAKASGAYLTATATNFNTGTQITERYLGGAWVKDNAPTLSIPLTNSGSWSATAQTTVAQHGNGLITLTFQSTRATSFAPGSSEVMANLIAGFRPGGNVAVGAGAFTTSFPSAATVIISADGNITMYNGPATQQSIGFTATFKVA